MPVVYECGVLGEPHFSRDVSKPSSCWRPKAEEHVSSFPMQSGPGHQESFFEYQNCKTFLDKAALMVYDGSNMPFIFFRNRIVHLMNSCPFEGSRLTLLQAACVKTASQTIANLVAGYSGLPESERTDMALSVFRSVLGKGDFLAEPEIRNIGMG